MRAFAICFAAAGLTLSAIPSVGAQTADGIGNLIDQQFQALGHGVAAPAATGAVQPPAAIPNLPVPQSQPQTVAPAVAPAVRLPDMAPLPPIRPIPRTAAAAPTAPVQALGTTLATVPQPRAAWSPRRNPSARIPNGDRQKAIDALKALDGGDNARALRIIDSIGNPTARAAAEYAWLRDGDSAITVDRMARFLSQNPDFPQERLRRIFERQILDEAPQAQSVLRILSLLPPTTGAGQLALAIAQDATGNRQAAVQTIRAAWRSGGLFGRRHEETAIRRFGNVLSKEDHKARMDVLLYREDNTSGLRAAGYLGGAQKALGEAWVAVDKRARNAGELIRAVPRSARRDPAFAYIEGRWMRRTGKELEAARRFAEAPRQGIVDGDAWWIERRLVARHAIEKGQPRLAYQVASGHGAQKNSRFIEAEFHAGWIALRFLNDPRTALTHFQRMAQAARTPISHARSHYWLGRAHLARGDQGRAAQAYQTAARFPTAYYGQLALNALGQAAITIPQAPAMDRSLANAPPMQAVEIYAAANRPWHATSIFYDLRKRLTNPGEIAYLAHRAGELRLPNMQVRIGKEAMQRGLPFDRHAFPTGVVPDVAGNGRPEMALVYAIARQESEFNAKARSPAGALGLMQVMPATGRGIARNNGWRFDQRKLASDPAYNTRFGATYLGRRIGQFNGSYIMAIASYNAGKGRVDEWIKRFGDPRSPNVDPIDWVELIPFTETRNYVMRVMENLQVYRVLLSGRADRLAINADLSRGVTN
jgi:soluble lytic murein transglycosylase